MQLTAQDNLPQLQDQLAEFIRFHGVGLPKALRFQGRLLAQLLIKLTPPKTRTQGKAAVKRDVGRAVRPLNPARFDSVGIRKLIRKRDYSGLQTVFSRFPEGASFHDAAVLPFKPELHRERRDSRGRVPRFQGQVTPDVEPVSKYVKATQQNVGRGKGGWAASLLGLGGKPAAWIGDQAGAGDFEDHSNDPVRGYIRLTNESEWASAGDEDRVVANALRGRTSAIRESLAKAQAEAMKRAFRK